MNTLSLLDRYDSNPCSTVPLQHALIAVMKYYGQQHRTRHSGLAGQTQMGPLSETTSRKTFEANHPDG